MTHKYRRQLEKEEELWMRNEIHRDKSGLLPIEAKVASERGPLGMADLRTALEIGDCGLGTMPLTIHKVMADYREGELDGWDEYTMYEAGKAISLPSRARDDIIMSNTNAVHSTEMNGVGVPTGLDALTRVKEQQDDEDFENDYGWPGSSFLDRQNLNSVLDSLL